MATEAESGSQDNPDEDGDDEKKKKPDTDDDEPPPPYSKDDPQDDKNDDSPRDIEAAETTNAQQPKLDTDEQTEHVSEHSPQSTQIDTKAKVIQTEHDAYSIDDIDYPHMDSSLLPTSPISPAQLSRISSPPKGRCSLSDLTRIKPEEGIYLSQPISTIQQCSNTEYRRENVNEFFHESLSSSDNTIVNSQSQPSQSELGPESTSTTTSGSLSREYNSTPVYMSSPSSDRGDTSNKVSKNCKTQKVKSKEKRTKGKRNSRESKNSPTNDFYPSTPTLENLSVNYTSPPGVLGSSQESSSCFEGLSPELSDIGDHLSEVDTEPREIRIRKSGSGYGINLAYSEKNSCIVVKSLSSNGAVGRDGRIRAGDRITAINGKSLAGLNSNKAKSILKRASSRNQELVIAYTPAPQLHGYILPSRGNSQYVNTPGTRSSITEGILPTRQTNYYPSPIQGARSSIQMHPVMAPGPQFSHGILPGMWHIDGAPTYHPPGVPPPPPAITVQGGYFPQYEEQISKPPPPYIFPHQPGPSPAQPMLSQGPHPYPTQPPQTWNMNTPGSNSHIIQHSPNMGASQWTGISHSHMTAGPAHREPPQYNDLHMMAIQPSQPASQQQPLNVGGTNSINQAYIRQQPTQSTHFVSVSYY